MNITVMIIMIIGTMIIIITGSIIFASYYCQDNHYYYNFFMMTILTIIANYYHHHHHVPIAIMGSRVEKIYRFSHAKSNPKPGRKGRKARIRGRSPFPPPKSKLIRKIAPSLPFRKKESVTQNGYIINRSLLVLFYGCYIAVKKMQGFSVYRIARI